MQSIPRFSRRQEATAQLLRLWLLALVGLTIIFIFGLPASQVFAQKQAPTKAPGVNVPSKAAAPVAVSSVMTNNWTNIHPDLYSVSAVSSSNVWAIGEKGELLHRDNNGWSSVNSPLMAGLDLSDIQMLPDGTGWIAAGARAFYYDGVNWSEQSAGLGAGLAVSRLANIAANDVWAVSQDSGESLAHWTGSSWMAITPTVTTTYTFYLNDISMDSPTDGWAVGAVATGVSYPIIHGRAGFVLHYNGQQWQQFASPESIELTRVSAPQGSQSSVWASGEDGGRNIIYGKVFYYSNGVWTSFTSACGGFRFYTLLPKYDLLAYSDTDALLAADNVIFHCTGAGDATVEFGNAESTAPVVPSLAGLSASGGHIWAVGANGEVLSRQNDNSWRSDHESSTTNTLYSVANVSDSEAWTVGEKGTILHYANDKWQPVTTTLTNTLLAVQMISATEGYIVGGDYIGDTGGQSGIIAHWDGVTWHPALTSSVILRSVDLDQNGNGWAVGGGGAILRLSGGSWVSVTSPTTHTLSSVVIDSPTHAWATGGDVSSSYEGIARVPVLLEYSGGQWVDRTASLPVGSPNISDLAKGSNPGELWAVATYFDTDGVKPGSDFLRLQDGTWTMPTTTTTTVNGVAGEALGEAWSVGCEGANNHYVAGAWRPVALPITVYSGYNDCLNDIALIPGRGGWAVGDYGKILRYQPLAPGQRFYDEPTSDVFFPFIEYMATHGIISGYSDNTFHPAANITRGQLTKIVTLAKGWALANPANPTFNDVNTGNTFYQYIETAVAHEVISGYADHSFRPSNDVTRGQLSKIVVLAMGWTLATPAQPTFTDVARDNTFYSYIETAFAHSIISGYADHSFHVGANSTRGQLAKIVYLAVTQ